MKNQNLKKFTLKRRLMSFVYAGKGIQYFFKTQPHAMIHSLATIIVIGFSIWLPLSLIEWCLIILAIGMVFTSELINTSIEVFIDFISPSYNTSAGRSKDLAAGGVLFAALSAAAIGLIIFIPKIVNLIR